MLTAGRFGRLTVVGTGDSPELADCVCICGARVQIRMDALLKDGVQSCGCKPPNWKRHPRQKYGNVDLTGQRFGRLVAIRPVGKARSVIWEVKCDCGTVKNVAGPNLVTGNTRSCGCRQRERMIAQEQKRRETLGLERGPGAPEPETE